MYFAINANKVPERIYRGNTGGTIQQVRIVEAFTKAKSSNRPNEDRWVVGFHHAAVVDGATDKCGIEWKLGERDVTSGEFAADLLANTIARFSEKITAAEAVAELTQTLEEAIVNHLGSAPEDPSHRPCASVVIYSRFYHQVWSIGDCVYSLDGVEHRPVKTVDTIAANMRAAVIAAHLASGTPQSALQKKDVGREAILPLLSAQSAFANVSPSLAKNYGFGVINGIAVPKDYVEVVQLSDTHRLVLASDGYPDATGTLTDAENTLDKYLTADPLCIDELIGTKAVGVDATSYDDRTWLELRVEAESQPQVGGKKLGVTLLSLPENTVREQKKKYEVPGTSESWPLPRGLAAAVEKLSSIVKQDPSISFTNGQSLMFYQTPAIVNGDIIGKIGPISYFAKTILRKTFPFSIKKLLGEKWPQYEKEIADTLSTIPSRSSYKTPSLGYRFVVLAKNNSGEPVAVLHQRAEHLGVDPGVIAATIAEGAGTADLSPGTEHSLYVNPVKGAIRGAAEELGLHITADHVNMVGIVYDELELPGYQFIGFIDLRNTSHASSHIAEAHLSAPDAFETQRSFEVVLTAQKVAEFLLAVPYQKIPSIEKLLLAAALEKAGQEAKEQLDALLLANNWGASDSQLTK